MKWRVARGAPCDPLGLLDRQQPIARYGELDDVNAAFDLHEGTERSPLNLLEGPRPVREVAVTALSDDVLGLTATMEIGALNRLMREGAVVNAIALRTDPSAREGLWRRLAEVPAIETTSTKSATSTVVPKCA